MTYKSEVCYPVAGASKLYPLIKKPRFGRKQSKSFGIRRGQISLQFKHISKKVSIYLHSLTCKKGKYNIIPTRDHCGGDKLKS